MFKFGLFLILAASLALGACSTQQADKVVAASEAYNSAVQNFQRAAAAVDGSVALTSATMGPYCADAIQAGKNLAELGSGSATVVSALNRTTAAVSSYCGALPQNTADAIVQLTAAAVAAKQARGS